MILEDLIEIYINLLQLFESLERLLKCFVSWKLGTLDYNVNVFIQKVGGGTSREDTLFTVHIGFNIATCGFFMHTYCLYCTLCT